MDERLKEIAARLAELPDEMRSINEADEFDAEAFEARTAEFNELRAEETRLRQIDEVRQAALAAGDSLPTGDSRDARNNPIPGVKSNDPFDLSDVRMFGPGVAAELRGRAMSAVEDTERAGYELTPDQAERLDWLLRSKDDKNGTIAKLVIGTGSNAYKGAFVKYLRGASSQWSAEERDAVERAMSLTDGSGGFAVPFPIDPTLIITGAGSTNPFRQISRVEPITTDSWQGVSAGATAFSFDAEATAVSDDTSTFVQPSVPVHKAQGYVPASIEIVGDYPGLAADLQRLMSEGRDDLEATAFATGTGTNQPTGIVTAIDGAANDINTATADVLAVADIYTVQNTLGDKYQNNASWVMNKAILNDVRQFGTSNNYHGFTVDLSDGSPTQLLGNPVYKSSAMDSSQTATATNHLIVYGDFRNYVIADRVGFSIEFIPHLFNGATPSVPTGQRAWYAWWRVGADSVNDAAFVLLDA